MVESSITPPLIALKFYAGAIWVLVGSRIVKIHFGQNVKLLPHRMHCARSQKTDRGNASENMHA